MKYRMFGYLSSPHFACISNCLSSSRLKMISFFGLYLLSTTSVKRFPKEPVPPVINTVFPFNISSPWYLFVSLSNDFRRASAPLHLRDPEDSPPPSTTEARRFQAAARD